METISTSKLSKEEKPMLSLFILKNENRKAALQLIIKHHYRHCYLIMIEKVSGRLLDKITNKELNLTSKFYQEIIQIFSKIFY